MCESDSGEDILGLLDYDKASFLKKRSSTSSLKSSASSRSTPSSIKRNSTSLQDILNEKTKRLKAQSTLKKITSNIIQEPEQIPKQNEPEPVKRKRVRHKLHFLKAAPDQFEEKFSTRYLERVTLPLLSKTALSMEQFNDILRTLLLSQNGTAVQLSFRIISNYVSGQFFDASILPRVFEFEKIFGNWGLNLGFLEGLSNCTVVVEESPEIVENFRYDLNLRNYLDVVFQLLSTRSSEQKSLQPLTRITDLMVYLLFLSFHTTATLSFINSATSLFPTLSDQLSARIGEMLLKETLHFQLDCLRNWPVTLSELIASILCKQAGIGTSCPEGELLIESKDKEGYNTLERKAKLLSYCLGSELNILRNKEYSRKLMKNLKRLYSKISDSAAVDLNRTRAKHEIHILFTWIEYVLLNEKQVV
ncbi:hypothetical protein HK098_004610 [Nowakowskiella sp. JEL0407]|nr:hypothetical protein HK098_004610 [Nowakowskiella sp. JEL0407]